MKIPGSYCFRGFSFYIPGKLQFLTGEQFLDREEKEVRLRNKKKIITKFEEEPLFDFYTIMIHIIKYSN